MNEDKVVKDLSGYSYCILYCEEPLLLDIYGHKE
jgi:hypothetical protein